MTYSCGCRQSRCLTGPLACISAETSRCRACSPRCTAGCNSRRCWSASARRTRWPAPVGFCRAMPGALYEAGVAITVAVSFAPQLATAAVRVRRARRLRGRPSSGVRSWLGIALPVLEDALERSIELAAAMDSRGFGRRGAVSAVRRRLVSSAVVTGLIAVAIAVYELLDATSPTLIGLPLLVLGTAIACGAVLFGGRQPTRTKYRPDSWHAAEWIVVASGVAALAGMLVAGRLYPGSLHTTTYPLVVPQLPWPAMVGLVLALIPAWATSPQIPALQGIPAPPTVDTRAPPNPPESGR